MIALQVYPTCLTIFGKLDVGDRVSLVRCAYEIKSPAMSCFDVVWGFFSCCFPSYRSIFIQNGESIWKGAGTMAEREASGSIMTEKLLNLYREEAGQETEGKSIEELENELKRSGQGKGFFKWLGEKIGALLNLAKVAVMSVFLGRRETAKRMEAGEREARQESLKKEAQTAIKKEVLKERILEEKMKGKAEQESGLQKSDHEQEKEFSETVLPSDKTDHTVTAKTIFAQQLEQMSEKYQTGLKAFLSMQTGIDEKYIVAQNSDNQIKLSFPCADRQSEYYKGMTINVQGCCTEDSKTARALAAMVLYYTANVYRDSKNQTQFPGTIPSKNMIRDQYNHFLSLADKNPDIRHEVKLFGHTLSFWKNERGILVQLDGKRVHIDQEQETVERIQKQFRNAILGHMSTRNYSIPLESEGQYLRFQEKGVIKGDYARISELSSFLHDVTRSDIRECYYSKYTFFDLQAYFQKALENVTKDDGGSSRGINFHGHHIHLELNGAKEITGVIIDHEVVYGTVDGRGTDESAGTLTNDKIAEIMALTLEGALFREGMYWNIGSGIPEQPVVSELDEEGRLSADDKAYSESDFDERDTFMEHVQEEAEIYDLEALEF